jgi:hypothetical protein
MVAMTVMIIMVVGDVGASPWVRSPVPNRLDDTVFHKTNRSTAPRSETIVGIWVWN